MNSPYHETLPEDYFNSLFSKIKKALISGENVCLSVLPGGGARTVYNFLANLIESNKLFSTVLTFNPSLEKISIVTALKKEINKIGKKQTLIIIRDFEQVTNKSEILTQLDNLRRLDNKYITFMSITDHTLFTNPDEYTTQKSIFFSEFIYISPFNETQTKEMLRTMKNYYGWRVEDNKSNLIFKLSGGFPRLIKYICKENCENGTPLTDLESLTQCSQIQFQLDKLSKVLIKSPTNKLYFLGIVDQKNEIKSSLLSYYLKNYISEIVIELYPELSLTESKILTFLIETDKQIITLDKIADLMKMSDENFSLWAIYKVISRLKPKIKNNFTIKNIKGKGYLLKRRIIQF